MLKILFLTIIFKTVLGTTGKIQPELLTLSYKCLFLTVPLMAMQR